jgi:hypothetical protein
MLEKLTIEEFSKHLNHKFKIQYETGEGEADIIGSMEAELVEVSKLGERQADEDQRQSFSVIFRGPFEPELPQRVYSLEHEGLGKLDLFLVPIGPDEKGMLYQAVFT